MNCKTVPEFIAYVERQTKEIWLDEPCDIYCIKNGYLGSEAGCDGQYFSPLVMLSGEIRCLGTHVFADLSVFCRREEFTLDLLKTMLRRMISTDVGVIAFFGLRVYGATLKNLDMLVDQIESKAQFEDVIDKMFKLTNRYQMWLHQIFPWGFGKFMPRRSPEQYADIADKLIDNGEISACSH